MSLNFESYAQKGNDFVNLVNELLEFHDRNRAGRISRCVLHAVRDRLTVEESLQLISQLPMALKGVYVDGWSIPSKHHQLQGGLSDFLDHILVEDGKSAWKDFSTTDEILEAVTAVFKALACYISNDEMEKIINVLPFYLKIFIRESLAV